MSRRGQLVVFFISSLLLSGGCGPRSNPVGSDADLLADADDAGNPDAEVDVPCVPGCDGGPCGPGEWVTICAGSFLMGSPADEVGRFDDELQHQVTLTHHFLLLSTEVTQRDFREVMGYDPSEFEECGPDCPVESINVDEALGYCNALSDIEDRERCYDCVEYPSGLACSLRTGLESPYHCSGYRLPTEAEWEYASRAGTTTATYNGDLDVDPDSNGPSAVLDPIAWWGVHAAETKHEVGLLEPNAWGLYDMIGNLEELTHDTYEQYLAGQVIDPYREIRDRVYVYRGGGYWIPLARYFRSAKRRSGASMGSDIGFRPARTIEP